MTRKLLLLAAAFVVWGVPVSGATVLGGSLTFTFSPSLEIGPPGGSVIFQGTITSSADDFCCLNDLSASFDPFGDPYLSADPNFFFGNVFAVLFAPDDTYTGPILEVLIAPNTPGGLYSGSATILGGGDAFTFDPLVSQDFQVEVTPEPGMGSLTLAGLATLAAVGRRRQRR